MLLLLLFDFSIVYSNFVADYVYNPIEARIRKAMREAKRDRLIGASPMLPRPSARRVSHGWVGAPEELRMVKSNFLNYLHFGSL